VSQLADNEYYVVTIRFQHGNETWEDVHWVKETSLRVPDYLPDNSSSDQYVWSVTVMLYTHDKDNGQKEGVAISLPSKERVFYWTVPEKEMPPTREAPPPRP